MEHKVRNTLIYNEAKMLENIKSKNEFVSACLPLFKWAIASMKLISRLWCDAILRAQFLLDALARFRSLSRSQWEHSSRTKLIDFFDDAIKSSDLAPDYAHANVNVPIPTEFSGNVCWFGCHKYAPNERKSGVHRNSLNSITFEREFSSQWCDMKPCNFKLFTFSVFVLFVFIKCVIIL